MCLGIRFEQACQSMGILLLKLAWTSPIQGVEKDPGTAFHGEMFHHQKSTEVLVSRRRARKCSHLGNCNWTFLVFLKKKLWKSLAWKPNISPKKKETQFQIIHFRRLYLISGFSELDPQLTKKEGANHKTHKACWPLEPYVFLRIRKGSKARFAIFEKKVWLMEACLFFTPKKRNTS